MSLLTILPEKIAARDPFAPHPVLSKGRILADRTEPLSAGDWPEVWSVIRIRSSDGSGRGVFCGTVRPACGPIKDAGRDARWPHRLEALCHVPITAPL